MTDASKMVDDFRNPPPDSVYITIRADQGQGGGPSYWGMLYDWEVPYAPFALRYVPAKSDEDPISTYKLEIENQRLSQMLKQVMTVTEAMGQLKPFEMAMNDCKLNPRLGAEMIEWWGEQKEIIDELSKRKKPKRGFLAAPKGGNQ